MNPHALNEMSILANEHEPSTSQFEKFSSLFGETLNSCRIWECWRCIFFIDDDHVLDDEKCMLRVLTYDIDIHFHYYNMR